VCVTTAFKRLLRLDDVNVTAVEWFTRLVVVTVVLRRRRLACPTHGVVVKAVPFAVRALI